MSVVSIIGVLFWVGAYTAEMGIYCFFGNNITYSVSAAAIRIHIFLEHSCSNLSCH